jgi:esterase/lipase superfamily enzyme
MWYITPILLGDLIMDYMLVARSKSADGCSNEPGAVYFLGVPSDEDGPKFRHKMSPRTWCDAVLEQASSGTRNTQTTGDIVFYVHRYNNSQETVLERQRKLQRGLEHNGFDGVVVSFDWPSADNVLNYLEDRHDAKKSALMLVKHGIHAFAKMQEPACKIDMHVLAHSMGAYVVREAFDDADDTADIAQKSWSVSQVMLVGADVSVSY